MDWPLVFMKKRGSAPFAGKRYPLVPKIKQKNLKKRAKDVTELLNSFSLAVQPFSSSPAEETLFIRHLEYTVHRDSEIRKHILSFTFVCSVIWGVITFLQLAVRIINSLFSCVFKPPWSRVLFLSVRQLFCSMFLISLHLCLQYCYL